MEQEKPLGISQAEESSLISDEVDERLDAYTNSLLESPEKAQTVREKLLKGLSIEERESLEGLMSLVSGIRELEETEMTEKAKRKGRERMEKAMDEKFG